jgi:outer membrane immunogenic protein
MGGHLGFGSGRANSANLSGFTIGAQAGMNFHVGPIVLGGELDATYSGIDYRGFTDKFQQKWLMSGRARAGYAFDRFMPYVTAGVAHTSGEMKVPSGKSEQGHYGYVIGIGSEAMLTERVSARVELLHYRFGAQTYTMPAVTRSTGIVTNTIRFGLNYRF